MGWFGSGRTEEAKASANGSTGASSGGDITPEAAAPAPANTNAASTVAAEEYDVISEGFLRDIARLKGRAPVKGVPVLASVLYPVSAAIAADERKKEAPKKAEENPKKSPGQIIPGQGIFLGRYAPKDREGNSLGKIFNVFAAPEDLTDAAGNKGIFKYVDAVKRIASLKNWHGHDGTNYATDKELYKALRERQLQRRLDHPDPRSAEWQGCGRQRDTA